MNPVELKEALTAVHEAGHAVTATLLGGEIRTAVVTPAFSTIGVTGRITFRHHPDSARGPILFSGSWAESRWIEGGRSSHRTLAAARCYNSADEAELAALVASGAYYYRDADHMLERCWPAVMSLGGKLFTDGEIIHENVLSALRCDGKDQTGTAFRLANLRSGVLTL